MAKATLIISPLNGITYKEVNNLLPNFVNTLSCDEDFNGIVNENYVQKFLTSETIITQLFSDYDTIEAYLIDSSGTKTELTVSLVKQSVDKITFEVYSYYEFSIVGRPEGKYSVAVKGIKSGEENKYFNSEPFEITKGITGYRYAHADGTKKEYQYIPNHIRIVASNTDSNYVYWGEDRITGNPFEVKIWIPGTNRKQQPGGEIDVYDNLGNLAKLEQISQRIYELKTDDIPVHLALKVNELAALDFFSINDEFYVSEENGENEYFGNYNGSVLTMALTQKFVVGINSDDRGFTIINENEMASIIPKQINNASGSQQLTVDGGYSLNQITLALEQGTSADITIGITPGGNELMRTETINTANPIKNIARNYVNLIDQDASFTVYIDISGVGASATVILQTILNKQQ